MSAIGAYRTIRELVKINGSAYGNRTRLSALRGPCPKPIDERAFGYGIMLAVRGGLSIPGSGWYGSYGHDRALCRTRF
jgi:hypothetical protein